MASKVDNLINRLEQLKNDVDEIKRKGIPLLPLPPIVKGGLRAIAEPTDRIITEAYFDTLRGVADIVLPADSAVAIINDPDIAIAQDGQMFRRSTGRREVFNRSLPAALPAPVAKPRKVTKKMKQQRKIQSTAFKNANQAGRKLNGEFRAGFDQSRIARMAQKECTKERIRLGLCDDPKKKMKRKSRK